MNRYHRTSNSYRYSTQRTIVNSKLLYLNQFITPRGSRNERHFETTEDATWRGDFDIISDAEVSIQSANNNDIKLKVTGTGYVNVDGRLVADEVYQRHPTNQFALLVPTGSVIAFSSNVIPGGWLLCNGQTISRTTYDKLFAIIGTVYGNGDGSTTFNLPNLVGRVVVGLDGSQTEFNSIGETGGTKTHTLTSNEMPSHNHTINDPGHTHSYGDSYRTGNQSTDNAFGTETAANEGFTTETKTTGGSTTGIIINSTGGGQAHNNLQPYFVLNYIIKV